MKNHSSFFAAIFLCLSLTVPNHAEEPASYTLETALEKALSDNFTIQKAREDIEAQLGRIVEIRSSLLPQLSLRGDLTQNDPDRQQTGDFSFSETNWNVILELRQNLYTGGLGINSLKQQRSTRDALFAQLKVTINEVLLSVRERFYEVLLAAEQIEVQRQNIELLESELQTVQRRRAAGTVSDFDVLTAEVALANAQPPLIRAQNRQRIALERLSQLLGQTLTDQPHQIAVSGELIYQPIEETLTQSIAAALQQRPELEELELQSQSLAYRRKAIASERIPDISAFAGYGVEKERDSSGFDDAIGGWQVGVQASWNIFDGWATRGRLAQNASEQNTLYLETEETKLDITIEVREAFSLALEAEKLVTSTRKVVSQAQEGVRLASERYSQGVSTQLDLLNAQVALTRARENAAQALYDHSIARARLSKAIGEWVMGNEATSP